MKSFFHATLSYFTATVLCVAISLTAFGQQKTDEKIGDHEKQFIPYRLDDKWGYCDENKNILIKPEYQCAGPFTKMNLAEVRQDNKIGYINKQGKLITEIKYDGGGYWFTESKQLVSIEGHKKWGMIDTNGNVIIPIEYNYLEWSRRDTDLVLAAKDNKVGFLDLNGKIVVPLIYDQAHSGSDGMYAVKQGGKWGFVNRRGQIVIPIQFDRVGNFNFNRAAFQKDNKWGFMDKSGKTVIEPVYEEGMFHDAERSWNFTKFGAWVGNGGKYGLIDTMGKEIAPFVYEAHPYFSDGMASVQQNKKFGFIDSTGKLTIPCQYERTGYFWEGLAPVSVDGNYGFINKAGQMVIQPKYTTAVYFYEGLAEVSYRGGYGFIDKNGKEVVPLDYEAAAEGNHMINGLCIMQVKRKFLKPDVTRDGFYCSKNGKVYYDETHPVESAAGK